MVNTTELVTVQLSPIPVHPHASKSAEPLNIKGLVMIAYILRFCETPKTHHFGVQEVHTTCINM
jgi:hypothetical protein